jgi:predicted O-methyltransferase YrrM
VARSLSDVLLAAPSVAAAGLGAVYAARPQRFPLTGRVWDAGGVLPVPYHYYQPIYRPDRMPPFVWGEEDPLEGIDLRVDRQLELLEQIARFSPELAAVPDERPAAPGYYFGNQAFGPGSAELLYGMVRLLKPRIVLEIGSGMSSLLSRRALRVNSGDGHEGQLISVEPYAAPWLETLSNVSVIRRRVEELDVETFDMLGADDILFVDSAHVVRPGGDVRFIYGQVIPRLAPGVVVHVHDVYLPWEYPREWAAKGRHFWNEQYLLQAFLSHNAEYEVLLAAHYLHRRHSAAMEVACPSLGRFPDRSTSSFWFRRRGPAV